jgi:hypothetical protein
MDLSLAVLDVKGELQLVKVGAKKLVAEEEADIGHSANLFDKAVVQDSSICRVEDLYSRQSDAQLSGDGWSAPLRAARKPGCPRDHRPSGSSVP